MSPVYYEYDSPERWTAWWICGTCGHYRPSVPASIVAAGAGDDMPQVLPVASCNKCAATQMTLVSLDTAPIPDAA